MAATTEVSLFRLYLMRAVYAFTAFGLLYHIWPQIVHHSGPWPLWYGVGASLLGATSILAAIGIRYPLSMLPVMFSELIWKSIWLGAVALPQWLDGQMDADTWESVPECLLGAIFLLVIPWSYVLKTYVLRPGDRWR
ncbi:MAG: hypothetical protein GC190_13050 [Alphaproteobacteria bacterium]|nr:hypothetical protein [Alphaproteobacteria bacterium]